MNISKNNFITSNEILSDVLPAVDDIRMEAMSKGFYESQIQQALEGLAFDTFFDEKHHDFEFPIDTLTLEMPIGTFNVRNIYLYTGTKCDITKSQKVWWKRNYFTNGNGYFADNKGHNSNDPFLPSNTVGREAKSGPIRRDHNRVENHYFYNIQNGMIMFSSVCRAFPKVHIVSNGTGCEIGEIPIIPMFLREAVKDYVCEAALRIRMAKDPRTWSALWQIYDRKLNRGNMYGMALGSWERAESRIKSMSTSERNDLYEYLNRNQWQSGL